MKVELDLNSGFVDRLVVSVLRTSASRAKEVGDDPEYTEKYCAAADVVIEHFGGIGLDEPG